MSEETYNITLRTLSPVHIGSGITYRSSEFIEKKIKSIPTIKRINLSKYISSLNNKEKEEFLKHLSKSDSEFSNWNSEINSKYVRYIAINNVPKDDKNINPISECVKTSERIYIPGSSTKGAIKTALLYHSLNPEDFDNIKKINITNSQYVNNWMDSFFSFEDKYSNKKDISQYLRVEDGFSDKLRYPKIYKAWNLKFDKKNKQSKKNSGINEYLETTGLKKHFKIKLIIQNPDFCESNESNLKYLNINYIKEAAYKFSEDLIKYELNYLKNKDANDLKNFYKDLKKKNTSKSPLLRIGYGSSLMGTTIALFINKYDKNKEFCKKHAYKYPSSRKVVYTKEGRIPLGWVKLIVK